MKINKTFSIDEENVRWLKNNTANTSEFIDSLITEHRARQPLQPESELAAWEDYAEQAEKAEQKKKEKEEAERKEAERNALILNETPEEREARRKREIE